MPAWLLIQNNCPQDEYSEISFQAYKGFQKQTANQAGAAALLIESPGGEPNHAFRIARLFQRRFRPFTAVIPQYAKSAATLISLGANEIVLGREAELGPLDLQVFDFHQERMESALNSVQALERLNAFALTAVDQTMQLLIRRIPKRTDILLPFALEYVATLLKPLLEKVDTTDYARKSRDLKVAEEYAARLMRKTYGFAKSKAIARRLVQNYPTHGFVIDREEITANESQEDSDNAFGLGLRVTNAAPEVQQIMDDMLPYLDAVTAVGRIEEVN
jgi:hypothetical protein